VRRVDQGAVMLLDHLRARPHDLRAGLDRLVRRSLGWRWAGVVHERLVPDAPARVEEIPADVLVIERAQLAHLSKSVSTP
jgi:hypothetical protein